MVSHRVWVCVGMALMATLTACGPKTGGAPPAAGASAAQVAPAPTTAAADPAHDHAGCTAPSWAPERITGFAIDSCESRAWAKLDVDAPAAGGAKTVAGPALTLKRMA